LKKEFFNRFKESGPLQDEYQLLGKHDRLLIQLCQPRFLLETRTFPSYKMSSRSFFLFDKLPK